MKTKIETVTADTPQYNTKTKKKFVIRIILSLLAGAVFGFVTASCINTFKEHTTGTAKMILQKLPFIQLYVFPWVMLAFTVVCIIINEHFMKKSQKQIDTWDGEDDEHINLADLYLNKTSLVSSIQIVGVQIFFAIITYSLMKNIQSAVDSAMVLIAVVIYFIGLFSCIFQQNHLIRLIKEYAPEKKGSVYDKNFHDVWLASCDEAEQHMIYEAAYKTFRFMNHVFSICLTAAVIAGMIFPIGILCAIMIGLLWLIITLYYSREAIKLENKR